MVKISALPPMASPDGADQAPVVDDSVSTTKKMTLTQVKAWLQSLAAWVTGSMIATGTIKNTNIDMTTAGKIWWEELGRTTLASAGDTLTVASLPARRYLRVYIYLKSVNVTNLNITFNGDTGANYGLTYGVYAGGAPAGGSAVNSTGFNNLFPQNGANTDNIIAILDIYNYSGQQKLTNGSVTLSTTSVAAGAPTLPFWGKWNNNSQISSITATNPQTGDYGIGTEMIVLGHD